MYLLYLVTGMSARIAVKNESEIKTPMTSTYQQQLWGKHVYCRVKTVMLCVMSTGLLYIV